MTVYYHHVAHAFKRQFKLYSFKEILVQSRREMRSLSDCDWTRTHNDLVRKQTLNHLAKVAK